MKKLTIALLFGGRSNEREVSERSGAQLLNVLRKEEHRILPIGITRNGSWYLYGGSIDGIRNGTWEQSPSLSQIWFGTDGSFFTDTGRMYTPDVVFPALHGQFCEDGRLQGFLDYWGVPYVGCKVECSAVCMNKVYSKQLALNAGVPVLPYVAAERNEIESRIIAQLPPPIFIKPARSGSSVGATKVTDFTALPAALDAAALVDPLIIAEPFFKGRELEVAVFDDGSLTVSRVGEITYPSPFYDYQTKYATSVAKMHIPADIPPALATQARNYAALLFRAFECRHLARIDFFTDGESLFFNEINTLPGFTSDSMYPTLMEDSGIPFVNLITRLCCVATNDRSI